MKLGKKRRESSKRNCYIISPRVIIKAIIIIRTQGTGGLGELHVHLIDEVDAEVADKVGRGMV